MLCVITALASFTINSEASASEAFCTYHSSENIDSWVSDGLALAGLPDTPYWHSVLKNQAWIESGFIPDIVNTSDANFALGHPSTGLEQVEVEAWDFTYLGSLFPFAECADDPVVSVSVRAELFALGYFN